MSRQLQIEAYAVIVMTWVFGIGGFVLIGIFTSWWGAIGVALMVVGNTLPDRWVGKQKTRLNEQCREARSLAARAVKGFDA